MAAAVAASRHVAGANIGESEYHALRGIHTILGGVGAPASATTGVTSRAPVGFVKFAQSKAKTLAK